MASGGYEQDFDNITPGEELTLAWDVIDSAGAELTSFAGWSVVKCYFTTSRGVANGLAALATASLLTKTATIGAAPRITAVVADADWAASLNATMLARRYFYELWREDDVTGASPARIAYGKIDTLD